MPFTIPTYDVWPVVIPDATEDTDGLMTAADKAKLDSLTPGGNNGFYNQEFEGSLDTVHAGLHEIFRFEPDLSGFSAGNLTVEFMIFSHGGGDSTLRQTVVFTFAGVISSQAGAGAAVVIGDGLVNATVTFSDTDIIISMTGSNESPPNVFVVAECRISDGTT